MSTSIEIPWMKQGERIGLGDAVKKVTDWLGIQPGPNCKCEERRLSWNELLSLVGTGMPSVQPPKPQRVPIERPPTDKEV